MVTNRPATAPATTTNAIRPHVGNVLMHVANTYAKLPQTIQEIVQNGIDAGADRLIVVLDWKQRELIVVDNGEGTTASEFQEALESVGMSIKDKGKLGQFGLGLLAPLSKCRSFTFTSRPKGTVRSALRWTFRADDIKAQRYDVSVPCTKVSNPVPLPPRFEAYAASEFDTVYQTQVYLRGVTQDRVISAVNLDDLAADIRTKFAIPMRERKIMVRLVISDVNGHRQMLDVSPLEYNGEPLPTVTYNENPAGSVEFELYKARRGTNGRRTGQVSVMQLGDTSIVTIKEFVAQARRRGDGDILSDAMQVLASGYFEGVIRCEGIELSPNRKGFIHNDALEMLYLVIDQWYEEHGKGHFTAEQDQSRATRYQELGLKVLKRIQEIQDHPSFSSLLANMQLAVECGSIGDGHTPPVHGEVNGPEEGNSTRGNRGGPRTPRNPKGRISDPAPRDHTPQEDPDDLPLTIRTPAGNKRRLVKGDSEGLRLATDELAGDSRFWTFDFQDGTLTFNTLHPVWVKLDETNGKHTARNARWIVDVQFWVVWEVLYLLLFHPDPEAFEVHRHLLDDRVASYADTFIIGAGAK